MLRSHNHDTYTYTGLYHCLTPPTSCERRICTQFNPSTVKVIPWYLRPDICYIVICWFMQKYTYICWIHTDAIIIKTLDDKVARTNDARKEDAGRLLYKIFYLTSLFVSFERVVPSLRVRGSWGLNITEIFWSPILWPSALCLSRSPWLLNRSTGFPYYFSSTSSTLLACLHWLVEPNWPELNCPLFKSSALYYLQTPTRWYAHASATPSDIWGPGCVTSAFFGMACVIVIERK